MSEDGSISDVSQSRDQSTGRKWRGKFLAKASKLGKAVDKITAKGQILSTQSDDNVSDFLYGSENKTIPKPRIDTASAPRWLPSSSATNLDERPGSLDSRPATSYSQQLPTVKKKKRLLPPGTHVSFTTDVPAIIGEGGDEAELPAKDVVRAWAQAHRDNAPPSRSTSSAPRKREEPEGAALVNKAPVDSPSTSYHLPSPRKTDVSSRKPVPILDGECLDRRTYGGTAFRQNQVGHQTPEYDMRSYGRSRVDSGSSSPRRPGTATSTSSSVQTMNSSCSIPVRSRAMQGMVSHRDALTFGDKPALPKSLHTMSPVDHIGTPPNAQQPTHSRILPYPVHDTPPQLENDHAAIISSYLVGLPTQSSSSDSSRLFDPPSRINSMSSDDDDLDIRYICMQRLHGAFRTAAKPLNGQVEKTLEDWLRAGMWWFLKGRSGVESSSRTKSQQRRASPTRAEFSTKALQSHVDVAKAWWIAYEAIPNHLNRVQHPVNQSDIENSDSQETSLVEQAYKPFQASIRALAVYMDEQGHIPPSSRLVHGLDTSIWLTYPLLPPGIFPLTADVDPKTLVRRTVPGQEPFFGILLGDTTKHFSYNRMFVEAEVIVEDEEPDDNQLLCILSVLRPRTDSRIQLTIVSQDGQINLHIQSNKKQGLTWDSVEWKVKTHSIRIRLAPGLELVVRLWEEDYKKLCAIHDQQQRVEKAWYAQDNETTVFNAVVDTFHYMPSSSVFSTFPSKPIKYCNIRVFERSRISARGSTQRTVFDGHRLIIVTPPGVKTLNSTSTLFMPGFPILFSYRRKENGAPALFLSVGDHNTESAMVLIFREIQQRAQLHSLLDGTFVRPNETISDEIPLQAFQVSRVTDELVSSTPKDLTIAPCIVWQHIKIISEHPASEQHEASESFPLRISISCDIGTICDRVYAGMLVGSHPLFNTDIPGPGELRLGLDVKNTTTAKLFRSAQTDLTISFAENLLAKEDHALVASTLSAIASSATIRAYKFPTPEGQPPAI